MATRKILQKIFLVLVAAILVTAAPPAAAEPVRPGAANLRASYQRTLDRLEHSAFGLPLALESFQRDDRIQVDLYGILQDPFRRVGQALSVPANWCDIVSLHLNVKACTYRQESKAWLLTFYLGRKFYQPPEKARQIVYHFQKGVAQDDYLDILLTAEEGPLGTENHRLRFEALAVAENETFLHVGYEFNQSWVLRLAQKLYFAALAEDKVGFTVIGSDGQGRDILVDGARGATERNAVRYYFAIQAFLATLAEPVETRFRRRIGLWYDLTAPYKEQLYEMSKADYLAGKIKEHDNQLRLQEHIGTRP